MYALKIKIKESESKNKALRDALPLCSSEGSENNCDITTPDEQPEENIYKVLPYAEIGDNFQL